MAFLSLPSPASGAVGLSKAPGWAGGVARLSLRRLPCPVSARSVPPPVSAGVAPGASLIRRTGVRLLGSAPDSFRETFSVDLLGLGRMAEQTLEAPSTSELIPYRLRRPLGIVFEEQAAVEGASAPGSLRTVVAELVAGGAAQVRLSSTPPFSMPRSSHSPSPAQCFFL